MPNLYEKLGSYLMASFTAAGRGDATDDDGTALANEIAAAADLREALAAVVRSARRDEGYVRLLAEEIATLQNRKARLEARAERKRSAVLDTMLQAGPEFRRLEVADFTVSVKDTSPRLVVTDPDVLPAEFFEDSPPRLNKTALKAALRNGADLLGAALSNGAPTLQISVK
jgi:hypothetical protein